MERHHDRAAAHLQRRVAALSRTDAQAMLRMYRQLTAADLRALAAFPGQPHPLLHAIVACVHCLLLDIAREQYETLVLEALPWQLLRLELLADAPRICERLNKRLRQLQVSVPLPNASTKRHTKQRRGLALAQRRFVYVTLGPLVDVSDSGGKTMSAALCSAAATAADTPDSLLHAFARVSSIGAQLAAWVFCCLFLAEHPSGTGASNSESIAHSTRLHSDVGSVQAATGSDAVGLTRNASYECCNTNAARSPKKLPSLLATPPSPTRTLTSAAAFTAPAVVTTVARAPTLQLQHVVRAGVKVGSHFLLFQAHVYDVDDADSMCISHTHPLLASLASVTWAVLRLETIRPAERALGRAPCGHASSVTASFWRPHERLPRQLASVLTSDQRYTHLPYLALRVTLLQLALHADVLTHPSVDTTAAGACAVVAGIAGAAPQPLARSVGSPRTWSFFQPHAREAGVAVLLKFAAVAPSPTRNRKPKVKAQRRKRTNSLVLAGIGSASVCSSTTVAALRIQLGGAITAAAMQRRPCGGSEDGSASSPSKRASVGTAAIGSFQFLYRTSLLPVALEASVNVLALLPFALVVFAIVPTASTATTTSSNSNVAAPSLAPTPQVLLRCGVALERLHTAVSIALCNAGPPNHFVRTTAPHEPTMSYYALQQPVVDASDATTTVVPTSAVLAEFFVHWRAFVHFQQLQDSTAVLEEHFSARTSNNDNSNDAVDSNNDASPTRRKRFKTEAQRIAKYQLEAAQDALRTLQAKALERTQPHKRFHPENEYLVPLYATADVTSATTALLSTPFSADVLQILTCNDATSDSDATSCVEDGAALPARLSMRLVLQDVDHVIHVRTVECIGDLDGGSSVQITFERDESCASHSLLRLTHAYVWRIVVRRGAGADLGDIEPEQWLQDMNRYVIHPTLEFQDDARSATVTQPPPTIFTYFRIPIACKHIEQCIEARFWSREVDWETYACTSDARVRDDVLQATFTAMCLSHPRSLTRSIDSVKFSKLLRETQLQPDVLSVGDAAFVFARHRAAGSHYEMEFAGFVAALEQIADRMLPLRPAAAAVTSPSKKRHGQQHRQPSSRDDGSNDTDVDRRRPQRSPFARLFFEHMVHAPSVALHWRTLIETWRFECKCQLLASYAQAYSAATRIASVARRNRVQRIHNATLTRLRTERLAATVIQSFERRRGVYQRFHALHRCAINVQRRVHARYVLRCLRNAQAAYVERMRVRLVVWMRQRHRVLCEWKKINAQWVARRERIKTKRSRLVCSAVYELETQRVRVVLYHSRSKYDDEVDAESASTPALDGAMMNQHNEDDEDDTMHYELEVLEPVTSWSRSVRVSHGLAAQLIYDNAARRRSAAAGSEQLQHDDGTSPRTLTPAVATGGCATSVGARTTALGLTRGVRGAQSRSTDVLDALVQRLRPLQRLTKRVAFYRHPLETSVGKLVFRGIVAPTRLPRLADASSEDAGSHTVTFRVVVKLLLRVSALTVLMYAPPTSTLERWDVDASFVLRVLRFLRVDNLTLQPTTGNNDSDTIDKNVHTERQLAAVELRHRVARSPALVARALVSYLLAFDLERPEWIHSPDVVAATIRVQQLQAAHAAGTRVAHELQCVLYAQTCARRFLARRLRLRLALATYAKQFDAASRSFAYVRRVDTLSAHSDAAGAPAIARVAPIVSFTKPASLLDCDVPLPQDEWLRITVPSSIESRLDNSGNDGLSTATAHETFFNPFRGAFSHFNDHSAACRIQRWFRRTMWIGIHDWGLPQLTRALQFHNQRVLEAPPPATLTTTTSDIDAMTRRALQLHFIEHEFKRAQAMYDAILKIQPDAIEAIVGLALLLIYTCRYPPKQTWPRALELLAHADALATQQSIDSRDTTTLAIVLAQVEECCLSWKLFLAPTNAHAIGNYAVYLQCVRHELDKAELLYRRAIDVDASNTFVLENYRRLERERTPDGLYSAAGPSAIAQWRAKESERIDEQWAVMLDPAARLPEAQRFYRNVHTRQCQWHAPSLPVTTSISDNDNSSNENDVDIDTND